MTRAGFAPVDADVATFAPLTHRAAVDRLLAGALTTTVTPPPAWIDERLVPPRELRAMSDEARRAELQKQVRMGLELRGWWLREMVTTPSPLTERMTLFWHDPARFARQARLASADGVAARGALAHVLRVESDIVRAGADVRSDVSFNTEFPRGAFGIAVQHAAGIAATGKVSVLRLTLPGFDTHQNQLPIHANLLKVLAESVAALRSALTEHGLWDRTLILTYSEFGRRPRENQSGGTDHGTAGVLFAFGSHVRGGVHGEAPSLRSLDGAGDLRHSTDFRRIYASVLENWWQLPSERVLQRRFEPLKFIA